MLLMKHCGKNVLELDRPEVIIRRMRIACGITTATNIHSDYVIFIVFPLQKWLHERASMLRCKHTACLVLHKLDGPVLIIRK